ncbi:MAG: hypothetical protein WCJ18_02965 [Planctomycetota bacterium]
MIGCRAPARETAGRVLRSVVVVGVPAVCAVLMAIQGAADDVDAPEAPQRRHPPHGTPFWFEVVESFNAKYEGDTPGHIGRGGGVTLHPHVALGDWVHHRVGEEDRAIGFVTGVTWDRLKGSLTVEFRPREDHRIAVGDEVWIDLNPAPEAAEMRGTDALRK